jgi:hypothetical protein
VLSYRRRGCAGCEGDGMSGSVFFYAALFCATVALKFGEML